MVLFDVERHQKSNTRIQKIVYRRKKLDPIRSLTSMLARCCQGLRRTHGKSKHLDRDLECFLELVPPLLDIGNRKFSRKSPRSVYRMGNYLQFAFPCVLCSPVVLLLGCEKGLFILNHKFKGAFVWDSPE